MTRDPWDPPVVSVIVPTFNRADHIVETLESILAQDHPALEVVVVDDGSTDRTPELLAELAQRHDVLRVERQENAGQSVAVNRGFASASGELLVLVSDDDPLLPAALSRLVDVLDAEPEAMAAFPDWFQIDAGGAVECTIRTLDGGLEDIVRNWACTPGPCTMFRARVLDLVGGWDPRHRFMPDFDFWLRVGLHGPLLHVPEVLATWRNHPGSTTSSRTQYSRALGMVAEHLALLDRFFSRDDLPPDIRALEQQARHAALSTCAILLRPTAGARFDLVDRLQEVMVDLPHPAPDDPVTWLHGEVRRRDRELELLRIERDILEARVAALQSTVDALGGRSA